VTAAAPDGAADLPPMPFYTAPFVSPQGKGANGRRWAMIALPREAWRPVDSKGSLCCCRYCTPDQSKPAVAYWDTLTFDLEAVLEGVDARASYCHAPELHGVQPKRVES
jgi:hypothetical protein